MIKLLNIVLCLFLSVSILAQRNFYEVRFSHEIELDFKNGEISPSRAGLLYSLIGEYLISNRYSEQPVSWGLDTLDLSSYQLKPALEYIVEQAKNHRVVIISENHLKPQHRIFATKIITELKMLGYQYFGLETFANENNGIELLDKELHKRGYPLNSPWTGTFTMEPQMSNLVREAIGLEYKLFAYERSLKIAEKDRDVIQAENIYKFLQSHQESKVIILCGFHHAVESDIIKRKSSKWMANELKRLSGIDPLTIYQDNFTEKFVENEHPILNNCDISEPSLFIDSMGNLLRITNNVDIEVVHPKTRFVNGRPSWLISREGYKWVNIDIKNLDMNFPLMVAAYDEDEENSVPYDRVELKHRADKRYLTLKPGKYKIEYFDGVKSKCFVKNVE